MIDYNKIEVGDLFFGKIKGKITPAIVTKFKYYQGVKHLSIYWLSDYTGFNGDYSLYAFMSLYEDPVCLNTA